MLARDKNCSLVCLGSFNDKEKRVLNLDSRIQIDTTEQDWQGIIASVNCTIEMIEAKIKQWSEYEAMKEECLVWLRDIDTKLHMFDLVTITLNIFICCKSSIDILGISLNFHKNF